MPSLKSFLSLTRPQLESQKLNNKPPPPEALIDLLLYVEINKQGFLLELIMRSIFVEDGKRNPNYFDVY